ncbi:MAG: hypothetical protein WBC22_19600 [Sedimentisphaerales bacterium]
MLKTIDQQKYVKGSVRITLVFVAIILLPILFCSRTLACIKVNEVSIYAGKSQEEADEHEYEGETMYIPIDSRAYFRAEIDDVCNPGWTDFVWQFDFDRDGSWDYDTLTYWLYCIPRDPPNPWAWTYDTEGWYHPKVKVELEGVSDSDAEDTCQVAVVTVTNVVLQTYGDNTPISGGKIFPGKKTYDDQHGPDRRKVIVKAYLNITPEASHLIYVRFKCWDVDDPCFSTAPLDPDDSDPDPNKHSIDNKGSFNFEGTGHSVDILAVGGVVYATFLVSMNPGDNYRITATTSQEANNDLTHYEVETGSIPSSVKRTPILTTWRKLWIEQDSMAVAAATGSEMNHVEGENASYETYDPGTNRTWINLGQNLPGAFDDEDQFKLGRYIAGGNTYTTIENTAYWFDYDKVKVMGDPTSDPCTYTLYDDDESTCLGGGNWTFTPLLPSYPSLGSWASEFHAAYIEPDYLPSSYSDEVPFDRNLSSGDVGSGSGTWNDDYDCPSSSSFWTELVVGAFQPQTSKDDDPGSEGGSPGVVFGAAKISGDDNQCVIYYETIKEESENAEKSLAHEVGHGAGIEDDECEDGCLMWHDESGQLGDNFCDACLLEMRKDSTY